MEDEVEFLHADKHEIFLQGDSITLGVRSQACPKYPKQQLCNISRKTWMMKLIFCLQVNFKGYYHFSNWYYHFRCEWRGMPKLPKITSFVFLCNILKNKWVMKLIYCMGISMKVSYKLILWFSWGWPRIPKIPKIASSQCFYNISKKVDRDEVDILHADKHQHFGHQSFLQVDAMIIDGHDKHFQHTQSNKFTNISKKKLGMEFIFCL